MLGPTELDPVTISTPLASDGLIKRSDSNMLQRSGLPRGGFGAMIVSCGDQPRVLGPAEHILDTVSLIVKLCLRRADSFVFCTAECREIILLSFNPLRDQSVSLPRSASNYQTLGGRSSKCRAPWCSLYQPFAKKKQQGPPQSIDDGRAAWLGVPAFLRLSDTAGQSRFLSRFSALRWVPLISLPIRHCSGGTVMVSAKTIHSCRSSCHE